MTRTQIIPSQSAVVQEYKKSKLLVELPNPTDNNALHGEKITLAECPPKTGNF